MCLKSYFIYMIWWGFFFNFTPVLFMYSSTIVSIYIDNQTHPLFNVVLKNSQTNIVPSTLSLLSIYNFELNLVGTNLYGCKCFPVICSSQQ